MVYYYAYGSNMDEERMIRRKTRFSKKIKGTIKGYKLTFNKIADNPKGAGYANIIPDNNSFVEGVVYYTDEASIRELDINEGVKTGQYKRENILVQTSEGELNCIVYIANNLRTKDNLKPTRQYLSHLLKGKPYLSENYFFKLSQTKTID